ncbi:MAG TPA: hypothetical protein V6C58_09900 [Allocoleopsis sp.]
MMDFNKQIIKIKNNQDLEQAIALYKSCDLKDGDLINLWTAIRDASLNQALGDWDNDIIPGGQSY